MAIHKDLKYYSFKKGINDLLAAVTIASVLLPQSVAYAILAGLPPIFGLYGSLVPLLVYPFISYSKYLAVGPVAIISIILYSGLKDIATPQSDEFVDLVLLSGLVAGTFQLVYAKLNLGVLTSLLSQPVKKGFIAAAVLIVMQSQLSPLLGLSASLSDIIKGSNWSISLITAAVGIIAILIILIVQRFTPKIPSSLVVVILGILATFFIGLDINTVGIFPTGLPSFSYDFITLPNSLEVLPTAFIISIISFIGSYSIAQTLEPDEVISGNKELYALGSAKLFGSFFNAMPASGSFSRSAILKSYGRTTGMATLLSGVFVGIVLIFFPAIFMHLPIAILSAIVLTSVFKLVDIKYMKALFHQDRLDFYVWCITFVATLIMGISNGVLIGIAASLLIIIKRLSTPHFAVLGRLPDTNSYRNIKRYKEALEIPNTLILRYDQGLFFGNERHFHDALIKTVEGCKDINTLLLHMGPIHYIDTTAMEGLHSSVDELHSMGIKVIMTNINGPVRDLLNRSGITEKLGQECFFLSIHDAIDSKDSLSNQYSSQCW